MSGLALTNIAEAAGREAEAGYYLVTLDDARLSLEISIAGEIVASVAGDGVLDLFAHLRSLKSAGARSIFIDGVLFALRAQDPAGGAQA